MEVSLALSQMTTVYNRKYLSPATLEEASMATVKKIFPLVLLGLASIPAWGQAGKNPPSNTPQVVEAPRVTPAGSEPVAQPVDPKTYLIGPEDVLHIEVYGDQNLTRFVPVRPDGKITMPFVGDIQAEGLTPERLNAQLKEALSEYIQSPQVTITVAAVNSKSFTVTGRVNRAGRWPLVTPTRVFDAIGLAGGFQEFANDKNIQIIRGNQRLTFNYKDFVKGKKEALDQNVWLQNGDTIVVK
jgi:polysaccharide export outer membrane protein